MFWDIDCWVAVVPGDVALRASKTYANYAMTVLAVESAWEEVPEIMIWPQHRVIWN